MKDCDCLDSVSLFFLALHTQDEEQCADSQRCHSGKQHKDSGEYRVFCRFEQLADYGAP